MKVLLLMSLFLMTASWAKIGKEMLPNVLGGAKKILDAIEGSGSNLEEAEEDSLEDSEPKLLTTDSETGPSGKTPSRNSTSTTPPKNSTAITPPRNSIVITPPKNSTTTPPPTIREAQKMKTAKPLAQKPTPPPTSIIRKATKTPPTTALPKKSSDRLKSGGKQVNKTSSKKNTSTGKTSTDSLKPKEKKTKTTSSKSNKKGY